MICLMSVNKYKPHLYIIPEDSVDRQLANGFVLHYEVNGEVQIINESGGWPKVIDAIMNVYVPILRRYRYAHVIGIIDCDNWENRIQKKLDQFPDDVRDRIFLLGFIKDPEKFKESVPISSYEKIGEKLAEECFEDSLELWNHEHLKHISSEIERAKSSLRPIIFPDI